MPPIVNERSAGSSLADHWKLRLGRRSLASLWCCLAASVLGWCFSDRGYDDPYITYRYAINLASGEGFVYNVGERVLSTTTPLYTLIMALVGLAGVDIPLASNLLSCISIAAGAWLLWRLCTAWGEHEAAVLCLFLYPTFPLLIQTLGAESTFYVALILLGLLLYVRESYGMAAVVLALAALTRADGVLAALIVGADFVARRWRDIPWRAIALYCGIVGAWFGFAWLYFGAPFPVTLAAKRHQGELAASESFLRGFLNMGQSYWQQPLYRVHIVMGAIGMYASLARWRRVSLLLGWTILYFVAYVFLGVTRYHWYYVPLVPGFVLLVALGAATASRWGALIFEVGVRRAVLAVFLLLLLAPRLVTLNALWANDDPRLTLYRSIGRWLQTNTRPDASVGTLEVGIIGYYAQRRMIDFAGLIQPQTALHLTRNTTYEDAALWAVDSYRPDYLVLQEGMFSRLEQAARVDGCEPIKTWSGERMRPLTVYKCDD